MPLTVPLEVQVRLASTAWPCRRNLGETSDSCARNELLPEFDQVCLDLRSSNCETGIFARKICVCSNFSKEMKDGLRDELS